jgi:hypothetical protein
MASIYELCLPCVQIAVKYLPIYIQGDDKLEYRIEAYSLMPFRIYLQIECQVLTNSFLK